MLTQEQIKTTARKNLDNFLSEIENSPSNYDWDFDMKRSDFFMSKDNEDNIETQKRLQKEFKSYVNTIGFLINDRKLREISQDFKENLLTQLREKIKEVAEENPKHIGIVEELGKEAYKDLHEIMRTPKQILSPLYSSA